LYSTSQIQQEMFKRHFISVTVAKSFFAQKLVVLVFWRVNVGQFK